jgi:TldD protein
MNTSEIRSKMADMLKQFSPETDYMDIRAETSKHLGISFTNDELERLEQSEDEGFSIRVCIRGGWGFVSLNSPDKLIEYARLAVEQAKSLAFGKTVLAPVEPACDNVKLLLKDDPRDISLRDKLDMLMHYTDSGRSMSDDINTVSAGYFEKFRNICFMTSEGSDLVMEKMDLGGGVNIQACKNGISQSQIVTTGSSNDFDVIRQMEKDVKPAAQRVIQLLKAPRVKAGRYTVVADPALGSTFVHEAFGHTSEADDYYKNPQMKKIFTLGRRFAPESVSIYDSGLDAGTRGYILYDDEGVPTEKTWLIRDGILVGRLHTRESAAHFGEKATGNARCMNYRYPPICRMRNTCIASGNTAFEDLISGIDLGVYALDAPGGTGGEMFSFDAAYGYMIRNGKLAELVRDVQLSGNLFKTLDNIEAVGRDFTRCDDYGGCGKGAQFPLETTASSPHIRIRDVTIGGA